MPLRPGVRYGRLTALAYRGRDRWLVRCDCGTEKEVRGRNVTAGCTRSCGCLFRELSSERMKKVQGTTRLRHPASYPSAHPLATQLRQKRLALGLSQEVVALRAGYHKNSLSDIERGKTHINIDTLEAFAKALGLKLTILLEEP